MSLISMIRGQMRAELKSRAEELADRLDLVPRSDLERVELMLLETRKRLQSLEEQLNPPQKRGRKPRKNLAKKVTAAEEDAPVKRKRGRPRKTETDAKTSTKRSTKKSTAKSKGARS